MCKKRVNMNSPYRVPRDHTTRSINHHHVEHAPGTILRKYLDIEVANRMDLLGLG
jgi:hypothetical protein